MDQAKDMLKRIMRVSARAYQKITAPRTYQRDECNTIHCETSDVTEILAGGIGKMPYRIATSGYSFSEQEYEETTVKFLKELDKKLGARKTGYITTPALCRGSIYDMTVKVGGLGLRDVVFFTTERYWGNTNLEDFRAGLNMRKYAKAPIYVFPDTKTYADATANAANILVCTGGKKVAVTEIVEALKRKSKVVLVINENLQKEGFDFNTGKVECAAKYFLDYIVKCNKDLPATEELDLEFLKTHPGRENQLLRVYFVKDDESIKSAAQRAAGFITSKTAYDFWPDKADEIDKTVGAVQRRLDNMTAEEHFLRTGERKYLYE